MEHKKKYSKISYVKRVKLIEMVQNQKIGVSKAAKKLRIKVPTAKVILSSYRKKGKIFHKKILKNPIAEKIIEQQAQVHMEQKTEKPGELQTINPTPVVDYPMYYYCIYPEPTYYVINY